MADDIITEGQHKVLFNVLIIQVCRYPVNAKLIMTAHIGNRKVFCLRSATTYVQCTIAVIFQLFVVFSYFRFGELRKVNARLHVFRRYAAGLRAALCTPLTGSTEPNDLPAVLRASGAPRAHVHWLQCRAHEWPVERAVCRGVCGVHHAR